MELSFVASPVALDAEGSPALSIGAVERLFARMNPSMITKLASFFKILTTYSSNKRPFVVWGCRHREGGRFYLSRRGGWMLKIPRSQLMTEAREYFINMARILSPIILAFPVMTHQKCAAVKGRIKTPWILPRACCRVQGVWDGCGQTWTCWSRRHFHKRLCFFFWRYRLIRRGILTRIWNTRKSTLEYCFTAFIRNKKS